MPFFVQQLNYFHEEIHGKKDRIGDSVLPQPDNAHPRIPNMTKTVIQEFESEVLPYSSYSPSSNFYLFQSLSNALRSVTFNTDVEIRVWLGEFFGSKPRNFYHH